MRIAVFATDLSRGGASIAMRRLICGLIARGHHVHIFCSQQETEDLPATIVRENLTDPITRGLIHHFNDTLQSKSINGNRSALSNTLFSASVWGHAVDQISGLSEFDIINIHWVAYFLSAETILKLATLNRPVVLTLHDMLQFTGGCHYSAGCRGFVENCRCCPQLAADTIELPRHQLARRRQFAQVQSIAAIAPSRWIAGQAIDSAVFRPGGVHQIDNALDVETYRPVDGKLMRTNLGIGQDVFAILLGSQNNAEQRKGFYNVIDTLSSLREIEAAQPLIASGKFVLLAFGDGSAWLDSTGFPTRQLGAINKDEELILVYAVANIFLLPSLEDNQPNVMLEAMACGTPVVSFAIGGMVDVIVDGVNGRLIEPFDCTAMASAILSLAQHPDDVLAMGQEARRTVEAKFSLDIQAARYEQLFQALIDAQPAPPQPPLFGADVRETIQTHPDETQPPTGQSVNVPLEIDSVLLRGPIGLTVQQQIISEQKQLMAEQAQRISEQKQLMAEQAQRISEQKQLMAEQAQRISELEGECVRLREQMTAIESYSDAIRLRLCRTTSWRLVAPLRALFGLKQVSPVVFDDTAERILRKMEDNCSITTSIWWDLGVPLRMIRRPFNLLRGLLAKA